MLFFFVAIALLSGFFFFHTNSSVLPISSEESQKHYVYIPSGSSIDGMANALYRQGFLKDKTAFIHWAHRQEMKPRSGRFKIPKGLSPYKLVQQFRFGKQAPLNLILNQKRTKQELAGYISQQLEIDSLTFIRALNNRYLLQRYNCTPENVIALMIPNTYEVYWNYSAQQFLERMYKESQTFWNEPRLAKARQMGLSTKEVITLASIVEKETNKDDEKSRIAGVYLNRLNSKGWRLDADPCVIFAWNDFSIRRLQPHHYTIDSPYNTYKYQGLPPGPICMPSIKTIEKTLDAEKHNYMFFCARPDGSGYHAFAKNLSTHKLNAYKYKVWYDANN